MKGKKRAMPFLRDALIVLCSSMLLSAYAAAADLPGKWKFVQSVQIDRTGLTKVSVPLESLSASTTDLKDLRLFDDSGQEVPYLLQYPTRPKALMLSPKRFQVALEPETTVVTLETGTPENVSAVTLDTPASDFIKAVEVEGSRDGLNWETLARGQPVFRQRNGACRLKVPFSQGVWAMLRLTLDDRRSLPIPVVGVKIHSEGGPEAPSVPLTIESVQRVEEPGRTRLFLDMPGNHFTLAGLSLETEDPLFIRPVALYGEELTGNEIGERLLSRDTLYRVEAEGRAVTENLTFAVDVSVHSERLVCSIQNDDNPPLMIKSITALRRPVHLIFFSRRSGKFHFLTGNPHCDPPRYDLADLETSIRGAALVEIFPDALSANSAYRPSEALESLQTLGAPLDVSDWKYRKRIEMERGGVQQVELDLEILARSSKTLSDLRLIREKNQIPYILSRTSERKHFAPQVVNAVDAKRPGLSVWKITLPYGSLPITAITCTTFSPYFKREVRLFEERPDKRGNLHKVCLATATWFRAPGKSETPLMLSLSQGPATRELRLEIENGDNQPLDLTSFQAWYPVSRILFHSEPYADLFIYYGNARVSPPKYDLALVQARLLAEEKAGAVLNAQEELKPGSRWAGAGVSTGVAFWSVLALVVVGLLFVLAKLLPKPQS